MHRSKICRASRGTPSPRRAVHAQRSPPVPSDGSGAPVMNQAFDHSPGISGTDDPPLPSRAPFQPTDERLLPNSLHASAAATAGIVTKPRQVSKRTIRRGELRQIVPLSDTTIYEMEQRGEFPHRFYLTPRCVVWDLAEVEGWIDERRRASGAHLIKRAPSPDVRKRKTRPVRG